MHDLMRIFLGRDSGRMMDVFGLGFLPVRESRLDHMFVYHAIASQFSHAFYIPLF